jgi:leucyl aminopeptidase
MKFEAFATRPVDQDAIVFIVQQDRLDSVELHLDQAALVKDGALKSRFKGTAGSVYEAFVNQDGMIVRVVLAGVGEGSQRDLEMAGGATIAKLLTSGVASVTVEPSDLSMAQIARFLFGMKLRSWRIDKYRTTLSEDAKPSVAQVGVVKAGFDDSAEWIHLSALADGVALTRELVSEPANVIYPESFVARCEEMRALGVEFTVLGQPEMEALGMGALLGVSQGSMRPPRLLAMRWDGSGGVKKKPLALVGKGVTFDTGGISIKPAAGMEEMKWDMGGAGAVAGTMLALAKRKSSAHVVGICGLVENMPDGNAQRPGDIVTSANGQTIEVINTDAEGRLVLCDAMHWTQQVFEPEYMIDLATLTGAMIISLGNEHAGMFSNDDRLAEQLLAAAKGSGDPLWRFPLSSAYDKLINSQIADMKNVGPRGAGSITAAQFLQRFVEKGVKWAHLDIAGMVWADKPGSVWDKGATGYGVRLLDRFVADNFEG